MDERETVLQEAYRLRREAEVRRWSPIQNWYCNRVCEAEEARDEILNQLGRVCLLAEKSLSGEASMTEEVYLMAEIHNAFELMGRVIEEKQTRRSNVQINRFNNPELDAIYSSAGL